MGNCCNSGVRRIIRCVEKSCKEMDPLLKGIVRKLCKTKKGAKLL